MRRLLSAIVFSCLLTAATSRAEQVVISEVMYHPADARPEYIEIWNITATPLDMAKWKFTDGVELTFPDFNSGAPQDHILKAGERIVISAADAAATRTAYGISPAVRVYGPWTGSLNNAGETITLADKNGVVVTTLDYKDGGRWPKAADGAGYSIVLRDEDNPIDNFRNWRPSQYRGGSPGSAEYGLLEPVANPEVGAGAGAVLVDYGDVWKYSVPASDPGTAWRGPGFDDSTWATGAGLLGVENAGLPAPGLQTNLSLGTVTYLFRKTFTFNGNPTGATYSIDQIIDDGVAYYLNGQPLGNGVGYTPGGAWDQPASRVVSDAAEELNVLSGVPAGLVNGTNVLTAEVHQNVAGSSDIVFGARFKISTVSTVVINEAKPGAAAGQGFVEFFNTTGSPVNLNGYYLSDTPGNLTKFQITTALNVPANGFATIDFAGANLAFGGTTVVYLTQPNGTTVQSAISIVMPLDGRSVGRNPAGGTTWFLFAIPTPGAANGSVQPGSSTVRLSEVHFTAGGAVDWVELQNTGPTPQSAANLYLASTSNFANKVALSGSVPAAGYASYNVNLPSDAGGDVVLYLIDSGDNVLGIAELEHVPGRDSLQAVWPAVQFPLPAHETGKTAPEWYSSTTDTRDAANAVTPTTSIVINEIMADPINDEDAGEFIELYNRSGAAVSLAGWKLRGGVDLDFPAVSIPAGGYIVVGGNSAFLQSVYGSATIVGNWSGRLGNRGDLIRIIDANNNLADEVDYKLGGDWPDLAAGGGSSMELVHPDMDNSRASAWRDSDESNKTTFQTYTASGVFQQLNVLGGVTDYKELHLHLVGDAHIIVRNVSVQANGTGGNLLTNGTVLATNGSSASGWLAQGTHAQSYFDGADFHLIGDGHGDNRPNRAEIDCTAMNAGTNYTISFQARWVSGDPRLLVQTWDHSIGRSIPLPVPANTGTPGAVNSRVNATALPQVDGMLHSPAVPKPANPVVVTARIFSAVPLSAVDVMHRADTINNANAYVAAAMNDSGTGGDAVAGDGVWSATITAHQVNLRIVQFYVRATALGGATAQLPKGGANRPALWIVDNRTLDNRLRRQRFVISAYDRDALTTASGQSSKFQFDYPRLSNHYFNATFIHNEGDVYYNAEIRKSGSPWTRTDGSELSRGKWKLSKDRVFRGREKSTFDNDAEGGSRHHNRLTRYWLYVLGHPGNENEFVYNVINGDGLAIREDTEPVDGELIRRAFADGSRGQLMRSDDEWWFQDDWNRSNRNADWSYKGTDSEIRYHSEWMTRAREADYDYAALTEFFKTVSNASSTEEQLNRVLDPQLTLMMAAVRGYIFDWDSLTLDRGKNGYFYRKPDDGRWMLLHWDSDNAFGDANSALNSKVVGSLPGWATYIGKPWTRRILNYWLTELLKITSGPNAVRTTAWLDAEEAASSAYSVNKSYYETWMTNRRTKIESEINGAFGGGTANAYTAPFSITTAGGGTTAANAVSLTGTAPSSAFKVVVSGHPEAVFRWTNQTSWTLTGIVLATGLNTLTLQTVDHFGNIIGTANFSITKTGNAPPVMAMAITPQSQNAALGTMVTLDAGASYDPDGGALTLGWSHAPASGASVTAPSATSRQAVFDTPGVYAFTATGTDPGAANTALIREITAYNAADFASFGNGSLEAFWTVQNLQPRGSFTGSSGVQSWYSLEDTANHLVLQTLSDAAKPLAYASPTHPLLQRPLPTNADFAFQTDLALETRRSGSFHTGLYVETVESGATIRYAYGVNLGNALVVKRLTSGAITTPSTIAFTASGATIRVRRVGSQLRFDRRDAAGVWTTQYTANLPGGSTAVKGGIFLATAAAESVRVAFDYVLLADTSNSNIVAPNLRITEIMYNPAAPDTVEYIELRNIGTQAINLQGCSFDNGLPFDAFTFGDLPLAPGQFAVITDDSGAFQARYGFTPAAEWPGGALNNGGERITLRTADGNPIHNFDYDDVAPWPLAPDGKGPSLEVIDANGDYALGTNWRASWELGGSPGYLGAGPDTDGDGQPDSWEALFGTDPNSAASRILATSGMNGADQPQITFPTVAGRNYRIDYTDSLSPANWQPLATVAGTGGPLVITDTTAPTPSQRFYKVTALP